MFRKTQKFFVGEFISFRENWEEIIEDYNFLCTRSTKKAFKQLICMSGNKLMVSRVVCSGYECETAYYISNFNARNYLLTKLFHSSYSDDVGFMYINPLNEISISIPESFLEKYKPVKSNKRIKFKKKWYVRILNKIRRK